MAGGDPIEVVDGIILPDNLPDLAIKCVAAGFNAAYHVRLNGVALACYTGRHSAGPPAQKKDLEKSISKLAGRYIDWSSNNHDMSALDEIVGKQLYAALAACRDGGAPLRLDVVMTNSGSNNSHIEYSLYSDGTRITKSPVLNSKSYNPTHPGGDGSILARTEGVSGHVTYALSVANVDGKAIWQARELEMGSGTPRTVGMWL